MKTTENGWTKDKIVELIQTNDRAVERALIRIYERQTAGEKATNTTRETNGRGFNATDAKYLTRVAKLLLAYGYLLPSQRRAVRARIAKYAGQLLEIAKERGRA